MRLFTALALPPPIVTALSRFLYPQPSGHLHITLVHLEEQPQERLSDIDRALMRVPRRDPIAVAVEGVVYFPDHHSPRALWAGVRPTEPLRDLREDIRAALVSEGVRLAVDPFRYTTIPRVTLAQLDGQPLPADPQPETFGSFTVERFHLYRSEGGGVYTQLERFRL